MTSQYEEEIEPTGSMQCLLQGYGHYYLVSVLRRGGTKHFQTGVVILLKIEVCGESNWESLYGAFLL